MNEPKRRGRPTNAERHLSAVKAAILSGAEAITSPAQAYADRVWSGQSESADRPWRLSRVKEALEGQGLSMDGVELPD
jgi:hypothetical protein